MSKTQGAIARDWYKWGLCGETKSIRTDKEKIYTGYDRVVARKMTDGFVAINTDIVSLICQGNRMFHSVLTAVGNRGISFSFEAFESTGIPWKKIRMIYRSADRNQRTGQLVLGIEGTERSIFVVKDRVWVGLVEPMGFYRDPLAALASLVPDKVKLTVKSNIPISIFPSSKKETFRHGEYYLIPRPDFKPPRGTIEKWKSIDDNDKRPHKVRDKVVVNGVVYIRGTIRHRVRRMISCRFWDPIQVSNGSKKLVEPWYEVVKSNQVGSWKGVNFWG